MRGSRRDKVHFYHYITHLKKQPKATRHHLLYFLDPKGIIILNNKVNKEY